VLDKVDTFMDFVRPLFSAIAPNTSVDFTLMESWWRGLENDGLTIGVALVAAVIVWA